MEKNLRDRNKIKKPDFYKVEEQELDDDISVDSDWDDEKEIDKISIKSEDDCKDKNDYEYDDFVVPDDEEILIETESESESESEFSDSIED